MKNFIGVILFLICVNLSGQSQKIIPDTLIKYGGQKILVCKVSVLSSVIYYSLIEKPTVSQKIDRKDVEKIIYKNGRVDVFNNAAFEVMEDGRWETVLVTYDKKDIQGLYKRKDVSATSSPTKSKKKAKENVIIKLQKLTANAGGTIVLITDVQFFGGFDENPGYTMEGIAYGTEPPEEGTNVVEDKSKTNAQAGKKQENQQKTGTSNTQNKNTSQQKTNSTPSGTQDKKK